MRRKADKKTHLSALEPNIILPPQLAPKTQACDIL